MSHLMSGIVLYGGIGWLLGQWLGHTSAFVAVGVIVGVFLSMVLVFARISHADQSTAGVKVPDQLTNGGRS